MNKVIEIGRLGRDPELTYGGAHKDTAICKFTMAVDRPTEGTDWIRITALGKNAENCNKYLKKGSMVAVDGRIQTGELRWQGRKEGLHNRCCGKQSRVPDKAKQRWTPGRA